MITSEPDDNKNKCLYCGSPFPKSKSNNQNNDKRYCSEKCCQKAANKRYLARKKNIPIEDPIWNEIEKNRKNIILLKQQKEEERKNIYQEYLRALDDPEIFSIPKLAEFLKAKKVWIKFLIEDNKIKPDITFYSNVFLYRKETIQFIIDKLCTEELKSKFTQEKQRFSIKNRINSNNNRSYRGEYTFNRRFSQIRKMAIKREISFELTKEDANKFENQPCYYCGGSIGNLVIALDRVDPNLGYTKDNCVSCCTKCNMCKSVLTLEEWIHHMKKILSNLREI